MPDTTEHLKHFANEVATHRERYIKLKAEYDEKRAEFEKSIEPLADRLGHYKMMMDRAEEMAREQAIDIFWETGEKKLPFGIGIRETTVLEYEPLDAMTWAIEHKIAIQLDIKTFEKLAKILELPFVKETNKVTATLPTDIKKLRE